MNFSVESVLLIGSILILVSLLISKFFDNVGVPTLLLFIAVGMLAGSEGPGHIVFQNAEVARAVGIVSLIIILFSGGIGTQWRVVKPVLWQGLSLATFGVVASMTVVGIFAVHFLAMSWINALLLGAIISSTDAAAVFSQLRSRQVTLKGGLNPLLELESGSNDPMAVFLTVSLILLIQHPDTSPWKLLLLFLQQMGLGALIGYGLGKAMVFLFNRLRFTHEGFYLVFSLAFACFAYAASDVVHGSGFLAVYLVGIIIGNGHVVHKKSMLRFFDGLAWLSQIGMFLTLGLFVFPSHLWEVLSSSLLASAALIFVARPLSVYLSLAFSSLGWREKSLISWVGLRGAVPVILATFPLLAKLPEAEKLFNMIFFIVLTSTLLQGWSLPYVAKILRVTAPVEKKRKYPMKFAPQGGSDTELMEFLLPFNAAVAGKPVVSLNMPEDSLLALICRSEKFIVPSGGTMLEDGDTLLTLVNTENLPKVKEIFSKLKDAG